VLACRKKSFYDAEVRGLRKQLRDTYESLLFLDAAFAAANDVEGQMWRTVFYMPIEEFRTRIRKAEKEAHQRGGPSAMVCACIYKLWCCPGFKQWLHASVKHSHTYIHMSTAIGGSQPQQLLPVKI
jgi:hypothetical protein